MIGHAPGFYPEPRFISTTNGAYKLMGDCHYVSRYLTDPLLLPHGTNFAPSIPVWCRILVPVTSNVVVMSLPHDLLFQIQPDGVSMFSANSVAYEILANRGERWQVRMRVRAALSLVGFISWYSNKRKIQNER